MKKTVLTIAALVLIPIGVYTLQMSGGFYLIDKATNGNIHLGDEHGSPASDGDYQTIMFMGGLEILVGLGCYAKLNRKVLTSVPEGGLNS
jgi:hypothetical protein